MGLHYPHLVCVPRRADRQTETPCAMLGSHPFQAHDGTAVLDLTHVPQTMLVDEALEDIELAHGRTRPYDDGTEDLLHVLRKLGCNHLAKDIFGDRVEDLVRAGDHS